MKAVLRITLLVSFLFASVAAPSVASANESNPWTGMFAYAGGPQQKDEIRRAIEKAISDMGPISRHVARSRLQQKTRPDSRLRIEVDDRMVGVAAGMMWASPIDGTTRVLRDSDGDTYRVRQRIEGNRLFQEIRDESLVIRNVFALSEDGNELAIRVRVTHSRIPEPLAYSLRYRRVE